MLNVPVDGSGEDLQIAIGGARCRGVGCYDDPLVADLLHDKGRSLLGVLLLKVAVQVSYRAAAEPVAHILTERDQFALALLRH